MTGLVEHFLFISTSQDFQLALYLILLMHVEVGQFVFYNRYLKRLYDDYGLLRR